MKHLLFLLLLLPLGALAQMRPSYTPIYRPNYTPSYSPRPASSMPTHYQQQQQQQQQAYNNRQAQRNQDAQQQMSLRISQQQMLMRQQQMTSRPLSPQQLMQRQALRQAQTQDQQKAEQKATEQLTQLVQEQQRKRQEHPSPDAQQAAAQQQADDKQLTLLKVKTYRDVFLQGQMTNVLQAQMLPEKAQADLQVLNKELLDKNWWSKQEPAQLNEKIASVGTALAALTDGLLELDPAGPPSAVAPAPAGTLLDEMLAKDAFDPATATQLLQKAATAEKQLAGVRLATAAVAFKTLSAKVAAAPAAVNDPKATQREVGKSLKNFNRELSGYYARVGNMGQLYQTQQAMVKAMSKYLARNKQ